MNEQQLLKEFGLTEYEIKVYLALARFGTATAPNIIKALTVPSNKVYASLVRLIEEGFVASLAVRPKQYKITGTQRFQSILKKKQQELQVLEKEITTFQKSLSPTSDLQDVAIVLKGKKKIIEMLSQASENAKLFGYSFVGDLYFDYMSAKSVASAVQRGVEFRFLVHKTSKNKPAIKQWKKIGVKIKYYPKEEQKSIRFSTFDGRVCRITIGQPEIAREEDYLSFWIESPAFALLLKDQFEVMWKKSVDS